MKRVWPLFALILVVGAGAFGLTRWLGHDGSQADPLEWMTREFDLKPVQRDAIARLQADYSVVCERHCEAIARARRAGDPAELARMEIMCTTATHAHLREVAAQMDQDQGRRFLELVEPKLDAFRHEAPLGLP